MPEGSVLAHVEDMLANLGDLFIGSLAPLCGPIEFQCRVHGDRKCELR